MHSLVELMCQFKPLWLTSQVLLMGKGSTIEGICDHNSKNMIENVLLS